MPKEKEKKNTHNSVFELVKQERMSSVGGFTGFIAVKIKELAVEGGPEDRDSEEGQNG